MAKNRVLGTPGELIEAPVPAGTKSGEPVLLWGAVPAIAQTNEPSADGGGGVGNVAGRASCEAGGVWSLPCADAVNTEGTALYIVAADRTITTTAAGNVLFGWSVHVPSPVSRSGGTKAAGAGNINVRLARV